MTINDIISFKILCEQNKFFNSPLPLNPYINRINIPIFYINLDKSTDRNNFILTQFNLFNIQNFQRISAIDSNTLTLPKGNTDFFNYNFLTISDQPAIACGLSHLKAILTAYHLNLPYVLIMEDDCDLFMMRYWSHHNISQYIQDAPPDCELLQLYSFYHHQINKTYQKSLPYSSALCYIITYKGTEKIHNFILKNTKNGYFNIHFPITADLFPFKHLSSYSIFPSILTPSINIHKFPSTIHPSHLNLQHYYLSNYFKLTSPLLSDFILPPHPILELNIHFLQFLQNCISLNLTFYIHGTSTHSLKTHSFINSIPISLQMYSYPPFPYNNSYISISLLNSPPSTPISINWLNYQLLLI